VWLIPVLVISGVAILLIIIWVLISALSRRREEMAGTFNPTNKSNGNAHVEDQERPRNK
jgi:hypothetical protein